MTLGLLSTISALLPWILGAAIGVHVARARSGIDGFTSVCIGIGGFFGYAAAALALWVGDQFGVTLLSTNFLLVLGTLTILALASLLPNLRLNIPHQSIDPFGWCLLGLLSIYLASWLYIVSNLPAQGWDVFDHWGKVAARFIEHSLADQAQPFAYKQYHPKTLSLVLVWSAWCGTLFGSSEGLVWSTPWLGFVFSVALLVAGWTYNQTKNTNWSLGAILLVLTIPLFENHALISGYGELPLGLSIIATTVLFAIAIPERSWTLIVIAGLAAASTTVMKNAGAAYAVAPILAALVVWSAQLGPRKLGLVAAFFAVSGLYIASQGLIIEFGNLRLGFDASDNKVIFGGGRYLELIKPSGSAVFTNEFQSRIANSSFSVSLIAAILALVTVYSSRTAETHLQLAFVSVTFALLFFEQFFAQYTGYGFKFATPERDTGLSRFSLPVFMMVPILLAAAVKQSEAFPSSIPTNTPRN